MKQFLNANKVLIFGLLSAMVMTAQTLLSSGPTDYKVLALSVVIAGIGFLAKNLRGQWATILGSILPTFGVVLTKTQSNDPISWGLVSVAAVAAVLGAVAPPPKSLSYESSPEIANAKQEAKVADASQGKNPTMVAK